MVGQVSRAGPPDRLTVSEDWQEAYARMEGLGLTDLLRPANMVRFTTTPSIREQLEFTRLVNLTHWRARCRNASARTLITALKRVEAFVRSFPSVELWKKPRHGADWEQSAYNERLFAWLQDFTRDTRLRGEGVCKADTAAGYISTLRAALSLEAEQTLLVQQTHLLQPAAAKHMRAEDGESADRRLRAGFRAYHQRSILVRSQSVLDIHSPFGMWAWDTASRNRVMLSRGGECGVTDDSSSRSGRWDPKGIEGARWMHVRFFPEGSELTGPSRFLIEGRLPLKKMKFKRYPLVVGSRTLASDGSADPLCPYAAYLRPWLLRFGGPEIRCDPVRFAEALAGRDPLINERLRTQHLDPNIKHLCIAEMPDGSIPRTQDILRMYRRLAEAAGLNPLHFGSNAGRIAGAEDIYDACLCQEGTNRALASEQGMRLIKERGRWEDDIGFIYARPSFTAHLVLSAQMGDHARADIESVLASLQMGQGPDGSGPFAQPAWL